MEDKWLRTPVVGSGGFIDVSKLKGTGVLWERVSVLKPMPQQPDAQGNYLYRTNSHYMRKLRAAKHCVLEVARCCIEPMLRMCA